MFCFIHAHCYKYHNNNPKQVYERRAEFPDTSEDLWGAVHNIKGGETDRTLPNVKKKKEVGVNRGVCCSTHTPIGGRGISVSWHVGG